MTRPSPPWTTVALLAGFGALAPLSIDMYLPALPRIAAGFHATAGGAAATLSLFFTGLALGQLVVGPLSDRLGRRGPLVAGLALFVLGAGAAALAGSIGQLIAARLMQGLGGAAITVTGRAVVRDLFDHRDTARFLSLMMLIGGLAPVLAPGLGSALLAVGGWRLIFVVTTAIGLLYLAATLALLPETRAAEARAEARRNHPLRDFARLLTNRQLFGYLLAAACNSGCFFTYLAGAPLVLMQVYGLPPWLFSLVVAANAVGLVGSSQLNRWLLKTRTPDHLLRVAARNALVLAVLFLLFAARPLGGLPVLLVLVFCAVASNSAVQANTMAGALSVDPARSGATAALFGATGFGSGTLCSLLVGLTFDGTPRGMIGIIGLALVGTAAALGLLVVRPQAADGGAAASPAR